MECQICAENLTAYLDAELTPAEASQISAHLKACAACRDEHDSLLFSRQFVERQLDEIEVDSRVWMRVEHQIRSIRPVAPRNKSAAQWFWIPAWTPFARAAAVLLVGLILTSVVLIQRGTQNTDAEVARSLQAYVERMDAIEQRHAREDVFASDNGFFRNNPFAQADSQRRDRNPFKDEGL